MKPLPSVPIFAVIAFAALGLFSFGVAAIVLLLMPDALTGDPVRGPVLALTHLITLGWIGSVLFAAAYLVAPVLAESPLWSDRLPALHFVCHVGGVALLVGGLSRLHYTVASAGAMILCAGLVVLVFNLLMTSSRNSRWTPANIGFQTAMFWLAITGVVALMMLRGRLGGTVPAAPDVLIALHAHFALFGFLAQTLLAVSLRIVPELLGTAESPAAPSLLAWGGWAALNGGLFLLFPATLLRSHGLMLAVGVLVALGVIGYAAHIGVSLGRARRHLTWAAIMHATGVLLLVVVAVSALVRMPGMASSSPAEAREWMRLYISLSLLGPFVFAILGTGQYMLPRLIWRLRFAPWTEHGPRLQADALTRPAAGAPAYAAMLLAWTYLALGQWLNNPQAIRLGALLLLVGFAWFLFSIAPALARLVVGVTPADFDRLASGAPARDAAGAGPS